MFIYKEREYMLVVQPNMLMLLMFCSGKAFIRSNTKNTGPSNNVSCLSRFIISFQVYRVSQEERTKLREGVPYVKLYRYNPKHLYPKLNGYGDNGKRSLKF